MPAIVAMMTTPIAQRETIVVIRSQSGSHSSSCWRERTLASDAFSCSTSQRKNRQMKVIMKTARAADAIEPGEADQRADGIGHGIRDALRSRLDAIGGSRVPEEPELVGVPQLVDQLR